MHIFIISWPTMHEKAATIAQQLISGKKKVSIVFSDDNQNQFNGLDCDVISRPNHLFWADKFSACLEALECDQMMIIHADCSCDNWLYLVNTAEERLQKHKKIAVWAPEINGTPFHLHRVKIADIVNENLTIAANTDGLIFALTLPVIQRMRQADYSQNIYGWGIDVMFSAFAHTNNLWVVIDKTVQVKHPLTRGYDSKEATRLWKIFLKQLTPEEQLTNTLLTQYLKRYDKVVRLNSKLQKSAINKLSRGISSIGSKFGREAINNHSDK